MYVCMCGYIYIYTHMYIYIYTHTCVYRVFGDQEDEAIEAYVLDQAPKKLKTATYDHAWIMDIDGVKAFSLGYVKGSTRMAALKLRALMAEEMNVYNDSLQARNPRLLACMQRVKVIVRVADPAVNFMRSMGVSHDNVRAKPHIFKWVRAVP